MGRFLNPGNKAFQKTLKSEIYVDKTMLLAYTNKVIGSDMACICNSRPRRFGKSITANMLAAYYSRGCDSFDMFSTLKVGRLDSFETNLNKYDVIHIDVQWCMMDAGEVQNTVKYINNGILDELIIAYGEWLCLYMKYLHTIQAVYSCDDCKQRNKYSTCILIQENGVQQRIYYRRYT